MADVWDKSMEVTKGSISENLGFFQKALKLLKPYFGVTALITFLLVYHGYLIAAGIHNYTKAAPLIYVTIFLWACYVLNFIVSTSRFQAVYEKVADQLEDFANRRKFVPITIKLGVAIVILGYTITEAAISDPSRLCGFFGYAFYIIFMFVCSKNRFKINWNIVTNALIFHYILAIIILQWPTGQWFFQQLAQLIVGLLEYAQVGAAFVFGFLAAPPNICDLAPVFIFTSLQTLIYFAAVVALLFYFGIIQMVLKKSTWFMKLLIGTTPIESVYAWACTFLGQSEAPMVIPYIPKLTNSEIFAIITTGFSCTGGTVFAAYVALGACPEYLLTASLLSAPMSLACAKMMFPETEKKLEKEDDFTLEHDNDKSFFDTLCSAGVTMVPTVFAIGATLVVVMSLLGLLDTIMFYIGDLIGFEGWSFQMLFGYLFFPLAYMMGITNDANQTLLVAQLMGSKTAVNEFIAYDKLGQLQKSNLLNPKSVLIATYALCGFSNFSSIGIQIEIIGGFAPLRKKEISGMMLRALCAGSISCFMNATIAGILISSPIICNSPNSNSSCFAIPSS